MRRFIFSYYLQPQPPMLKGFCGPLLLQHKSSNTIGKIQLQPQSLSIMPFKHPLPQRQSTNKIISM